jgi:D-alanine transaminase
MSYYFNGSYHPSPPQHINALDRGYLFGDGVYEVIYFYNNNLVDYQGHIDRLVNSLQQASIKLHFSLDVLTSIINRVISNSRLTTGALYLQITRGVKQQRDFVAKSPIKPSVLAFVMKNVKANMEVETPPFSVITTADMRWRRCDIKSLNLLAPVLAKMQNTQAKEAWLYDADNNITEGASSNAFIVKAGKLLTHPTNHNILGGITRKRLIMIAKQHNITVIERAFSLTEAYNADEAFISSTNMFALPIGTIDGRTIGDGTMGIINRKIRSTYINYVKSC